MLKRYLKFCLSAKQQYSSQKAVNEFRDVAKNTKFIDKSILIKDLIDDNTKYLLITRPRRWGKTINMNMIKTFFELQGKSSDKYHENKPMFLKMNINLVIEDSQEITRTLLMKGDSTEGLSDEKLDILNRLEFQNKQSLLMNHQTDKEAALALTKIFSQYLSELETQLSCVTGIDVMVNDYLQLQKQIVQIQSRVVKKIGTQQQIAENIVQVTQKKKQLQVKYEEIHGMVVYGLQEKQEQLSALKTEFNYINRYQGTLPVAFITFSSVKKGEDQDVRDYDKILPNVRQSIQNAFVEHDYIYRESLIETLKFNGEQNSNLTQLSISQLEKILKTKNVTLDPQTLIFQQYLYGDPSVDITAAIKVLTKHLSDYHNKRVIVIVDEYDYPINSAIGSSIQTQVVEVMKELFQKGLKDNDRIKRAIMTGILRIAKADLFSGLNNFFEYTVQDKKFAEYFGFTEPEVEDLLNKSFSQKSMEDLSKIKANIRLWYNGYTIGNCTLYNPWSILQYLDRQNSELVGYWLETASRKLLEKTLQNLNNNVELMELIKTGYYNSPIDKTVDLTNIENNRSAFFALLLHSGYLTTATETTYRIPNLELKQYFYQTLLPIWINKNICSVPPIEMPSIYKQLAQKIINVKEYRKIVENQLLNRCYGSYKNETDFQIMLGAVAYSIDQKDFNHTLQAEVSTKLAKRIDTLYFPIKGQSETILLFEIKVMENRKNLEEVLDDALWQVYLNQYLSKPLDMIKNSNDHCKQIFVRILVFQNDNSKWYLTIEEFQHTLQQAQQVNEIFSNNGKLIANYNELQKGGLDNSSDKKKKIKFREEFLAQYKLLKLNDLIKRFTITSSEDNEVQSAAMQKDLYPINDSQAQGEKKDENFKGISNLQGLTKSEIENILHQIIEDGLGDQIYPSLVMQECVQNTIQVILSGKYNLEQIFVLKGLQNKKLQKHVILLQILQAEEVVINIFEPLSKHDSQFKEQLSFLVLSTIGDVNLIFSG